MLRKEEAIQMSKDALGSGISMKRRIKQLVGFLILFIIAFVEWDSTFIYILDSITILLLLALAFFLLIGEDIEDLEDDDCIQEIEKTEDDINFETYGNEDPQSSTLKSYGIGEDYFYQVNL